MKKVNILFIMSIAVVTSAYSQITFIPKAGATLATVAYSDNMKDYWDADFSSKVGFIVGVAAEIPLGSNEMFALQPELLWHQKGFRYEYEDTEAAYSEDYNYTLNYIEVPVLVKAKFGNFYASAGPSIGVGVVGYYNGSYTYLGETVDGDKGTVKFGNEPANYTGDDEYVDNALDFGVQVGAGVRVSILEIDLRYGFGLTNLYDKPDGFSGSVRSQNRSLQLTVGVPLGGK